jgi:hypothetical protein
MFAYLGMGRVYEGATGQHPQADISQSSLEARCASEHAGSSLAARRHKSFTLHSGW